MQLFFRFVTFPVFGLIFSVNLLIQQDYASILLIFLHVLVYLLTLLFSPPFLIMSHLPLGALSIFSSICQVVAPGLTGTKRNGLTGFIKILWIAWRSCTTKLIAAGFLVTGGMRE